MKKLAICLLALLLPALGCEINVDEKPGTTVVPATPDVNVEVPARAPDVNVEVPAPAPSVDIDVTTPKGKSVDVDVNP